MIPSENADTYRWRDDRGLLNRLSYRSSEEIPRNWNMTSKSLDLDDDIKAED